MKVVESLNQALHSAMQDDPTVMVLGEDILDPYGGAFKVTKGLSTKYPDRVLTTPISEAAIVGVANGLALRGMRPIVEIMFGDFLTLAMDQILNHATKFRWMYNNQVRVPIVIRTPMGGRRGYGPTHSQTIEKHWLGTPGLIMIAPNTLADPGQLLQRAIDDDDPVLFIENKLLYGVQVKTEETLEDYELRHSPGPYPETLIRFVDSPRPQITFACYGYAFELVQEAMFELVMQFEVFSEAIVFTQLSPYHSVWLDQSLRTTNNLVTVEEGGGAFGWGSEVICNAVVDNESARRVQASRVAAKDSSIPASIELENEVLPSVEDIVRTSLDTLQLSV